jgi:hypothetical protein
MKRKVVVLENVDTFYFFGNMHNTETTETTEYFENNLS